MLGADADDCLNFVSGARQGNGGWHSPKSGQAIAFVGLELISLQNNSIGAQYSVKVRQHSLRENPVLEFGCIWGLSQHSCLACRIIDISQNSVYRPS